MNINALMVFRTIVLSGSAAAAARRLNRSQPTVSRLLALLEHELKISLFHRSRRQLVLTDEGAAFYKETERILSGLSEIPRIAADVRKRRRSNLRLVAMPRAVFAWVTPATNVFQQEHAGIRMSIDVARHQDMESWLVGRHYDFGVGVLPANHTAIETTEVFRAPLCVVVKKGDALARRSKVGIGELAKRRIVAISSGLLPREQMDHVFRESGLKLDYGIETTATYLACGLVGEGAGVTLIDNVSAAVAADRTVCVPFDPPQWVSFGLLKPRQADENVALKAYVAQLYATAKQLVKTHQVRLV
ncbi:MAG: LysR family transcriptional regulator [Burkholderiales bacterium]|nr:LysR family transcriptional regulator [Burkholderiales bacterium]